MKIIKPVIKVGDSIMYNKQELIENRLKLDLLNAYKSMDLIIWLDLDDEEFFNVMDKNINTNDEINQYYQLIFKEIANYKERLSLDQKDFNNYLVELSYENQNIESLNDKFNEILEYEIFINEMNLSELKDKLLLSINHYLALKLTIEESTSINIKIKEIFGNLLENSKGEFDNKKLNISKIKSTNKNFEFNKKILLIDISDSSVLIVKRINENNINSKEINAQNFQHYKFEIVQTENLEFRTHPNMSKLNYIEVQ